MARTPSGNFASPLPSPRYHTPPTFGCNTFASDDDFRLHRTASQVHSASLALFAAAFATARHRSSRPAFVRLRRQEENYVLYNGYQPGSGGMGASPQSSTNKLAAMNSRAWVGDSKLEQVREQMRQGRVHFDDNSWWTDCRDYVCNHHIAVAPWFAHEAHPFTQKRRIIVLMSSLAFAAFVCALFEAFSPDHCSLCPKDLRAKKAPIPNEFLDALRHWPLTVATLLQASAVAVADAARTHSSPDRMLPGGELHPHTARALYSHAAPVPRAVGVGPARRDAWNVPVRSDPQPKVAGHVLPVRACEHGEPLVADEWAT